MKTVFFDTETHLIRPGQVAPEPVCLQVVGVPVDLADTWTTAARGVALVSARSPQFREVFAAALEADQLVGTNLPFDLGVGMEWADLHREALVAARSFRLRSVDIIEKLLWIAEGIPLSGKAIKEKAFSLGSICRRYKIEIEKESQWRLRFAELKDIPPREWPTDAIEYAVGDVAVLPKVVQEQIKRARKVGTDLLDSGRQCAHAFWRYLIEAHGIRTDPAVVLEYTEQIATRIASAESILRAAGFIFCRESSVHRRTGAFKTWLRSQVPDTYPCTSSKQPSLRAEHLYSLGDPVCTAWADYSSAESMRTAVAEWQAAVSKPIHPRFDMNENSRARTWGPNVQNRRTDGLDRECLAPVDGLIYLVIDHSGLELDTVSQVLLNLVGWSKMAEARIRGEDLHARVGARVLGCTPEELKARIRAGDKNAAKARQVGKRANFGYAGGAGAARVAAEAILQEGLRLADTDKENIAAWARVKKEWLSEWPEFNPYFKICDGIARGSGVLRAMYTGKIRGRVSFTDAANGLFSELAAYLTHDVLGTLQEVTRCPGSPLSGCRVENFIHDEYLIAAPNDAYIRQRVEYLEEIVIGVAQRWLPSMRPSGEAMATHRWGKRARRVEGDDGRIVAWEWCELTEAIYHMGAGGTIDSLAAEASSVLQALGDGSRKELDARLHERARGWGLGPGVDEAREIAKAVAATV